MKGIVKCIFVTDAAADVMPENYMPVYVMIAGKKIGNRSSGEKWTVRCVRVASRSSRMDKWY